MSSTSTNKQPLLIDRPLHEVVALGPSAALSDSANLASIVPSGCVELVNCISTDGAVIDSLSLVATQASLTSAKVVFFLSTASSAVAITASNTFAVAMAEIASSTIGQRTNVTLPPLLIPVPDVGGQTAPTETSKKNTGLYIPGGSDGKALYVGLSEAILLPTPAATVNVFAQGGYF